MTNRCFFTTTLLLLLAFSLFTQPQSVNAAGKTDNNKFRAIRKDLASSHWVVRSFAVIEAGRYSEYRLVSRLRQHFADEKNALVRAFIVQSLAQMDRELLILGLDDKFVTDLVEIMAKTRNEFEGDVVVELMNKLMRTSLKKDVASWVQLWTKKRSDYKSERKDALKTYEEANGKLMEDPEELPPFESSGNGKDTGVLPETLETILKDLEKGGLDLAILLDDTGSMTNTINTAKDGIKTLMSSLKLISPDYRIGLTSYKDALNRTQDLTTDMNAMQKLVNSLHADGGDDFEEGVEQAFYHAYEKFSWRKDVTRMFVVVGDAPCHDDDLKPLCDKIKEAVEKGFTLHTINVGNSPQTNTCFKTLAKTGEGLASTMADQSALLAHILTLLFGKEYAEFTKPFCYGLARFQTPIK